MAIELDFSGVNGDGGDMVVNCASSLRKKIRLVGFIFFFFSYFSAATSKYNSECKLILVADRLVKCVEE